MKSVTQGLEKGGRKESIPGHSFQSTKDVSRFEVDFLCLAVVVHLGSETKYLKCFPARVRTTLPLCVV